MNQLVKYVFLSDLLFEAATINPFSPNLVRAFGTIDEVTIFVAYPLWINLAGTTLVGSEI